MANGNRTLDQKLDEILELLSGGSGFTPQARQASSQAAGASALSDIISRLVQNQLPQTIADQFLSDVDATGGLPRSFFQPGGLGFAPQGVAFAGGLPFPVQTTPQTLRAGLGLGVNSLGALNVILDEVLRRRQAGGRGRGASSTRSRSGGGGQFNRSTFPVF